MGTKDATFWDNWWKDRLSRNDASGVHDVAPMPLDSLPSGPEGLAAAMVKYGLRTVLCVGNGVSIEPRILAAAGCQVTALDTSSVATAFAATYREPRMDDRQSPIRPELQRPGGHVDFVLGDLLDPTVCPGPFEVVVERRCVQWFGERERAAALSALSRRLGEVGIFLSECLDDPFPPELGWSQQGSSGLFHASEPWFREHGWDIVEARPSPTLTGRIAWLRRVGTMRPPPGYTARRSRGTVLGFESTAGT
jgi:SAM-dependent methyltransferase